jgi:hypothetical protein
MLGADENYESQSGANGKSTFLPIKQKLTFRLVLQGKVEVFEWRPYRESKTDLDFLENVLKCYIKKQYQCVCVFFCF